MDRERTELGKQLTREKNDETESESGKTADSDKVSEAQERAGMPIRVLLCSDSFESYYHQSETVEFQADYACLTPEGETVACPAGTSMGFGDDSEGTWIFTPVRENGGFCLPDLVRGYEDPVYLGSLEIRCAPEGLLLINILDVETYLGNVVPSEMPAGYPAEALKARQSAPGLMPMRIWNQAGWRSLRRMWMTAYNSRSTITSRGMSVQVRRSRIRRGLC